MGFPALCNKGQETGGGGGGGTKKKEKIACTSQRNDIVEFRGKGGGGGRGVAAASRDRNSPVVAAARARSLTRHYKFLMKRIVACESQRESVLVYSETYLAWLHFGEVGDRTREIGLLVLRGRSGEMFYEVDPSKLRR